MELSLKFILEIEEKGCSKVPEIPGTQPSALLEGNRVLWRGVQELGWWLGKQAEGIKSGWEVKESLQELGQGAVFSTKSTWEPKSNSGLNWGWWGRKNSMNSLGRT